ncbi:hypothetical protein [Albimonas pacifica]|uniref:Uncharacterized protein n=1 Tax=Albimonas pacifica TaxID=1114924 RepID=A0A1I3HJT1_9RHOB|nr:hypothetical protein [Albimonas pacifica]SFI35921.1 hypothetical protein SAMN05216258_10633 [Albimonas pacifica]
MSTLSHEPPARSASWVFTQAPGRAFAAYDQARDALRAAGFSIGHTQKGAPTGLLSGDVDIRKWRNLSAADRAALHGTIAGDFRNGPVRVTLLSACPAKAAHRLEVEIGLRLARRLIRPTPSEVAA